MEVETKKNMQNHWIKNRPMYQCHIYSFNFFPQRTARVYQQTIITNNTKHIENKAKKAATALVPHDFPKKIRTHSFSQMGFFISRSLSHSLTPFRSYRCRKEIWMKMYISFIITSNRQWFWVFHVSRNFRSRLAIVFALLLPCFSSSFSFSDPSLFINAFLFSSQ